jgi:hypothetical protein
MSRQLLASRSQSWRGLLATVITSIVTPAHHLSWGHSQSRRLSMGVTKVTIIDSPEKLRARNKGYSIIIPQVRDEPLKKKDAKAEETSKAK